jgi:glutamate synthase (NADH)
MQDHGLDTSLDNFLLEEAQAVLSSKPGSNPEPITIESNIINTHRATGTLLSYEISKRFGEEGLPGGTITCNLSGHAGQSFGAWLAKGVTMNLWGDANDYVAKGLSGGSIAVRPAPDAPFKANEQVIIGNVALYGAVEGELFARGKAAERFCVRNSGARAVVEGCGDHGCEYMTGGTAVVLGPVGKNFGAGMSGGVAYVYDPDSTFSKYCNKDIASDLFPVEEEEDAQQLKQLLESHAERTGSEVAAGILADWDVEQGRFVKVYPHEYARALRQLEAEKQQANLLAQFEGRDVMAELKAALERAHDYQEYQPPPSQGKEIDWALLLKDASEGWMVSKRTPTWDKGRETLADTHADKLRGFLTYERLALPYRDAKERVGDYDEVLAKLDEKQRGQLLNTQVCCCE